MALAHCILGKFLGVGCHYFPPPLDVPTFSARCLHVRRRERPLIAEGGTLCGREMFRQIWPIIWLPRNSSDLLHAANLRHGTDGFTSPPKEGVLRIFSPLKIRRLLPGLNPRTWTPKASTLAPLKPYYKIISKIHVLRNNALCWLYTGHHNVTSQKMWILATPPWQPLTYHWDQFVVCSSQCSFCMQSPATFLQLNNLSPLQWEHFSKW